jgi:hypothetical protein
MVGRLTNNARAIGSELTTQQHLLGGMDDEMETAMGNMSTVSSSLSKYLLWPTLFVNLHLPFLPDAPVVDLDVLTRIYGHVGGEEASRRAS